MHNKDLGSYGEFLVITQCLKYGLSVFTDIGDNSKIDFIVEDEQGDLHKVQVKCYNREKSSPETTKLYLTKSGPNYKFRYDVKHIDWFAVVDNETDKIAWINAQEALNSNNTMLVFRHTIPKTKNGNTTRMFDDFVNIPFLNR
jgi:predicted AAA+ superfamily ATPase